MKRVQLARTVKYTARPLFRGYVFVEIDPAVGRWYPIRSTYGVRSLIKFGSQLGLLNAQFISTLRAREVDGVILRPETPWYVGQQVKLTGGPFDGVVGQIIEMAERDRLVVLMNLLNGSVRVKLSTIQLDPV